MHARLSRCVITLEGRKALGSQCFSVEAILKVLRTALLNCTPSSLVIIREGV